MVKILLIIIILALGVFFSSNTLHISLDAKRKYYVYSIIFLLILQSGLRNWSVGWEVGSDTWQYYYRFVDVQQDSWQSIFNDLANWQSKDPFYSFFTKSFQIFSNNYQIYLLFYAAIFMSALGRFILKNTTEIRHAILAFIIYIGYFYVFSISGIRQGIALAFLLWSFEYIKEKKFLVFLSFVLVAALFHISAIVFLPLYFIANLKWVKIIFGLSLFGFPIIMYFKNELMIFFVLTSGMEDRFGMYTEQFERGGSFILTFFTLLLSISGLLIYKYAVKKNPNIYRYYNTFALSLFFYPLQWINPNAGRISLYFAVIMMVWIPYLLDTISGKNLHLRQLIYILTIVLFTGLTMFTIASWDEYKFFWQFIPVYNF